MNPQESLALAVSLLPDAVRDRLDGDFPLDWTVLEDVAAGAAIGEAVRSGSRLSKPVEGLVHRLIQDVGIVPADVASGSERQGSSSAWIQWITIEADGESYQLRNDRSGEVFFGVRPEAIVGYATLGMELAAVVHETCQRWLEAGEHHQAAAADDRSRLAHCAIRMHEHLQSQPEMLSGHRTTSGLARTLESAWNSQDVEARAVLARTRLTTARGARAPARTYYAPSHGHRLRACDVGEVRWLRALAERAGAGAGPVEPEEAPRETSESGGAAAGDGEGVAARVGSAGVSKPDSAPTEPAAGALVFGSRVESLNPDAILADIGRAANRLSGTVRRRMGEAYGARVAEALVRLQRSRELDAARAELESSGSGRGAPRWVEELAAFVLSDTGAQTRDGRRTGSIRLDPRRQSDGGHRGTEVQTRAFGHLSPAGLLEQIHLSLSFAHDASVGLAALRSAGKEGHWALNEAAGASNQLSTNERETLEAAREIGQALARIRRPSDGAQGQRAPTALEQAEMSAQALRSVGPTVRTAAGWPGAAEAPDPRDPKDVARIVTVAQALHEEIRAIANRIIAGWVAEVQSFGERRNA